MFALSFKTHLKLYYNIALKFGLADLTLKLQILRNQKINILKSIGLKFQKQIISFILFYSYLVFCSFHL